MKVIRNYVDGPDGQIHYYSAGEGPGILLVHMAGCGGEEFLAVIPLLAQAGYRAVALDLPGFGWSDAPAEPPTVAHYAKSVLALAQALELVEFSIVGSHLGSMVATEVALQAPELTSHIVLVGPVPMTDEELEDARGLIGVAKSFAVEPDGSHYQKMWDIVLSHIAVADDFQAVNRLVCNQIRVLPNLWYGQNAAFNYKHVETLPRISQPCLVMAATGDIAYPLAVRAKEANPRFAWQEIEGGTALIADEKPAEWSRAVLEFLQS